MNGQPLRHKGKYAAFRRVRQGDDMRSNIHAGGKLAAAVTQLLAATGTRARGARRTLDRPFVLSRLVIQPVCLPLGP